MTHGKQNEATCNIKWKNETDTWNEQRRWRRRKIRRRRNRTTNDRLCMRGVWPLFAHTANLKTSKRVRICVQRTHASTKSQRRCSGKIWRSKWANLKSVLSENLDEKNQNKTIIVRNITLAIVMNIYANMRNLCNGCIAHISDWFMQHLAFPWKRNSDVYI